MRQAIEKHQEKCGSKMVVTVMFDDRSDVLGGLDPLRVLGNDAQALPAHLTDGSPNNFVESSLSPLLKASDLIEIACHRTRRRTLDTTEIFDAEELLDRSAKAVSAANPSKSSGKAATAETTAMTEQHYRSAA